MTKLTLSVDDDLVAAAKRLARQNRTSVSAMFSNMVRLMLVRENTPPAIPPGSITARLTGALRLPPGVTAEELLDEARMERFGGGLD